MSILRYLDVLPDRLMSAISSRCDLQQPNYEELSYFIPFQSIEVTDPVNQTTTHHHDSEYDKCESLIEQVVVMIARKILIPTLRTIYMDNQSLKQPDENSSSQSIDGILSCGGVEFWLHSRSADQGMFAHFDRDEAHWHATQQAKFPLLSSVVYLSDAGGPTIIRQQSANQSLNQLLPNDDESVVASVAWPRLNSMVIFPGNMLHGVLPVDQPASGERRVTLMINVWSHILHDHSCVLVHPNHALRDHAELVKYRRRFGLPMSSRELTVSNNAQQTGNSSLCGFLHVDLPVVRAQDARELLPFDIDAYRADYMNGMIT